MKKGLTGRSGNAILIKQHAGMVELADTYDSGSYAHKHAGSSPVTRTTPEQALYRLLRFFYFKKSECTYAAAPPFSQKVTLASALTTPPLRYQLFASAALWAAVLGAERNVGASKLGRVAKRL